LLDVAVRRDELDVTAQVRGERGGRLDGRSRLVGERPRRFAGGGGVVTSYLVAHPGHPALRGQTASLPHLGNDKDFLSTRVSHKLDLTDEGLLADLAKRGGGGADELVLGDDDKAG